MDSNKTIRSVLVTATLMAGLTLLVSVGSTQSVAPALVKSTTPDKGDYVGSETCQACHEDQFKAFQHTAHANLINLNSWKNKITGCESCHGPGGRGGPRGSAITNDSFLALVSDQGLRTIVLAGRPELGAPDWRGNVAGKPMSDQDVTDVVAWMTAQRSKFPGQPYSSMAKAGPSK